jgi:hypothetical protein
MGIPKSESPAMALQPSLPSRGPRRGPGAGEPRHRLQTARANSGTKGSGGPRRRALDPASHSGPTLSESICPPARQPHGTVGPASSAPDAATRSPRRGPAAAEPCRRRVAESPGGSFHWQRGRRLCPPPPSRRRAGSQSNAALGRHGPPTPADPAASQQTRQWAAAAARPGGARQVGRSRQQVPPGRAGRHAGPHRMAAAGPSCRRGARAQRLRSRGRCRNGAASRSLLRANSLSLVKFPLSSLSPGTLFSYDRFSSLSRTSTLYRSNASKHAHKYTNARHL